MIFSALSQALFTQVATCHATMYYYMGFAYLMLRRYVDAVKIFSSFLVHVSRSKMQMRKHQQNQVQKKVDRVYGLLAIVNSFTNQVGVVVFFLTVYATLFSSAELSHTHTHTHTHTHAHTYIYTFLKQ